MSQLTVLKYTRCGAPTIQKGGVKAARLLIALKSTCLSPPIPSTSATRVITGAIPAQRQAPRGPENPHGEHGEDCWIVEVEDVSEGVVVEERER